MKTRAPASIALAFLSLALLSACRAEEPKARLDLQLDPAPLAADPAHARPVSYADVIEPAQRAVVSVYSSQTVIQRQQIPEIFRRLYGDGAFPDREDRREGLGSGVIVSKNGYILTNNHVVAEADELKVSLSDGREFEAKLIGADPKSDVAVIKIDADDLPVATLADSDKLRVGDIAFAIGNPLGIGQTVTMGIVSATGRQVGILNNRQTAGYEDFIQTDAAINRGNSGGALVDAQGRLIGINTAILSGGATGGNIGIGFAIPVNMASSILTSLVETGSVQRGFLGVQIEELKSDVAEALGLKKDQRGVIITDVTKDSPAAAAGLRRSDVITAIDDRTVTTPQELRNAIAARAPGSEATVRYLREGKTETAKVKLASLDTAQAATELLPGVKAKPLDAETRRNAGGPPDLEGLVLTEIAEDSPFARRLLPGMVVVEINQQPVNDLSTARALLRPGRNLFIIFIPNRGFTPLAITVK
jgi:serine protease Do/serine protease DegQ